MENNPLGVRKGAWTKEEDILLRKCIEKYGEGKWHQVPLRAGLNRCRKSCRLRWLNYLRPNIKRGYFTKDEVDLIVRLHKLLGNRWSLIAGRIPGRTANDVKNFWNTHIDKKLSPGAGAGAGAGEGTFRGKTVQKSITENNIIRPRPRTFSKSQLPANYRPGQLSKTNESNTNYENPNKKLQPSSSGSSSQDQELNDHWAITSEEIFNPKNKLQGPPSSPPEIGSDECLQWWSNLLEISENGELGLTWFTEEDHQILEPILRDANSSDSTPIMME